MSYVDSNKGTKTENRAWIMKLMYRFFILLFVLCVKCGRSQNSLLCGEVECCQTCCDQANTFFDGIEAELEIQVDLFNNGGKCQRICDGTLSLDCDNEDSISDQNGCIGGETFGDVNTATAVFDVSDSVTITGCCVSDGTFLEDTDVSTCVELSLSPTISPTSAPTVDPIGTPTNNPTTQPTNRPTVRPTSHPTSKPTVHPSDQPTETPTANPTSHPTVSPSVSPTKSPTTSPTSLTAKPSTSPTEFVAVDNNEDDDNDRGGTIIGTVVGLLSICCIFVLLIAFRRRRTRRESNIEVDLKASFGPSQKSQDKDSFAHESPLPLQNAVASRPAGSSELDLSAPNGRLDLESMDIDRDVNGALINRSYGSAGQQRGPLPSVLMESPVSVQKSKRKKRKKKKRKRKQNLDGTEQRGDTLDRLLKEGYKPKTVTPTSGVTGSPPGVLQSQTHAQKDGQARPVLQSNNHAQLKKSVGAQRNLEARPMSHYLKKVAHEPVVDQGHVSIFHPSPGYIQKHATRKTGEEAPTMKPKQRLEQVSKDAVELNEDEI